ncbi:MAG: STAS-like domain-containing protein [Candidatus Rokuibacteriota bacterium]
MTTRVVLRPGANRFAEDKEDARQIRLERVMPALDRGDKVVLDFKDISYATQSYIHALIGEALQKHGEPALQSLEFKNCSAALRSVIELVVDYTLGGFPEKQART